MMWGYYNNGWDWAWMAGMMLLFWGGLIALVLVGMRSWRANRSGDEAIAILRQRLAKGEITKDEFETTRKTLTG